MFSRGQTGGIKCVKGIEFFLNKEVRLEGLDIRNVKILQKNVLLFAIPNFKDDNFVNRNTDAKFPKV